VEPNNVTDQKWRTYRKCLFNFHHASPQRGYITKRDTDAAVLSACPHVTCWYSVKTTEPILKQVKLHSRLHGFYFWATLCQTVRPMLSDRCPVCSVLSVLSVTLMYCGQTVGWIEMKLGMKVGLSPAHITACCLHGMICHRTKLI